MAVFEFWGVSACPRYVCFQRDAVMVPVCVRLAHDVPSVVVADEPRSIGDLFECFFCVHGVVSEIRPMVRRMANRASKTRQRRIEADVLRLYGLSVARIGTRGRSIW